MKIYETLNLIKEYWIIITAIIGFFYYFYKKEMENNKLEKWKNEYFDNILVPFHMQYLKKSSINIKKFLNQIDIFNKEYIPNYLLYLANEKEYNKIIKILIIDYEENYPSQKKVSKNSQFKILDVIVFLGELSLFFLSIGFFLFAILFFVLIIMELILSIMNNRAPESFTIFSVYFVLSLSVSFFVVYIDKKINVDNNDYYSSNKKTIHKIIKQKIKKYAKINNNLIYNSLNLKNIK